VTAVTAFGDDVALRGLTAPHDLGLTAPGDLAVIGFDDTEYGALTIPALTTIHIDAEDHGARPPAPSSDSTPLTCRTHLARWSSANRRDVTAGHLTWFRSSSP
jgi:hypothetical protein